MSKAKEVAQISLFPEMTKNEERYLKALAARAGRLRRYWFERVLPQGAPTPDLGFFVELCRRYSERDLRSAIQFTTNRIRGSQLAWEQAEQDCRKTVIAAILKRAKQKIAAARRKRPAGSASGAVIKRRLHNIRSA